MWLGVFYYLEVIATALLAGVSGFMMYGLVLGSIEMLFKYSELKNQE
jgi:hypothetical protein